MKKILIANRGEIAVRIIRTCKEMGIKTVAVYSDADRTSLHVRMADEAYYIGPSPSKESYLSVERILEAGKLSKADAIHPGYGFLSENADFAEKSVKEGFIFIGPSASAISIMGDKIVARQTMLNAGVPVVGGTNVKLETEEQIKQISQQLGFPLLIKAAAGGGGKGMRLVKNSGELFEGVKAAKSEALSAFGDDSVYIEKYITGPHHIEFQVFGDKHGNTIHLFERECSVQRRHQKIIEETPSPIVTPELREKMGECAVKAAKAVNYEYAGTIEFLVDNELNFYFLEMNTRLQVEHPVTEMVTNTDLVKLQICIARGEKLPFRQEDLRQDGHSIECRIYAEDPYNNYMPSPGKIRYISEPSGHEVRVDGYVYNGCQIPVYYDPLISKLIVWGKDRHSAINKMKRALNEYKIYGVKTNISFLERIFNVSDFTEGNYDTHFIEKNYKELTAKKTDTISGKISAMAAFVDYLEQKPEKSNVNNYNARKINPWKEFGRRRSLYM